MPRFISPDTGAREFVIAEDQLDYLPISVAEYVDTDIMSRVLVCRLTFTTEERLAIARGEDVYIGQAIFDHRFFPLQVSVGPGLFALPPEE